MQQKTSANYNINQQNKPTILSIKYNLLIN